MKKLLLPLFLLTGATLFAQPTISQAQFALTVGDVKTSYPETYVAPSVGASQTWNYTSFTTTSPTTVNIIAPGSSTIVGLPTSTLCYTSGGTDDCYLIDASGVYRTGIGNATASLPYNNSEAVLQFPVTFGGATVDAFRVNNFTAAGYPAHRSGTDSVNVVGYGTLNLPASVSINDAMLVRTAEHYMDSVDYGGFWVIVNYDYVTFNFYAAGYHGAIATFSAGSSTLSPYAESASYSVLAGPGGVQSFDISNNLELFPNPADDQFTITNKGNIDIAGYPYSIVNMNGQVVQSGMVNGDNLSFDVSTLPSGLYVMNINSNDFNASKRFIKN